MCVGGPPPAASLECFSRALTDDVEILLEVKQRDAAGVQAFPCQLQLQFLLQGWVRAHGIDPHHKAVLRRTTTSVTVEGRFECERRH